MTTTRRHLSLSIAGALRWDRKLTGLLTDDNGRELTDKEVRAYLKECQAKGWRLIPCGDCDDFDYQTGCRGHAVTESEASDTKKTES